MLSKKVFDLVKKKIPKISSTELIALRSGNTSLDRQILNGKVILPSTLNMKNKLPDSMVTNLSCPRCHSYVEVYYPSKNYENEQEATTENQTSN